ncbi:Tolloid-like protein 2,Zinc metalloproteinase nas-14,Zinc metalloproteinase nas-4,Astacin-like metalloendopeptidase [Mytilus edulis]|uniref:Metalloendopeptidase n=1 Tax=Mytilus edulis TaxID=6550 RepID=A0A8S3R908_MYTED|nr:Tolloid-like protein 2,Zinc metalloproteinase nas-14,Zinc metalloproteinase nas-4,Astacin-like metalloendopeptidase [Mytilus edulis]
MKNDPTLPEQNFGFTEQNYIVSVITDMMKITSNCVTFIPRTTEKDFVYIQNAGECNSAIGRTGGAQILNLGDKCLKNGTIMHELMHTLGFWHEHTRPDRDDYIHVYENNILKEYTYNFYKMPANSVMLLEKYDYCSIMHYSPTTFSTDPLKHTFEPRHHVDCEIGQRDYLTEKDIKRIQKLYNCGMHEKVGEMCAKPITPRNGNVTFSDTKISSKIQYNCSTGYVLIGPSERFCRNDVTWSGDEPLCLPTNNVLNFCNFDEPGTCNWNPDISDPDQDYEEWSKQAGSTKTPRTGPVFDHTRETSEGFYMYVESSEKYKPTQNQTRKFRIRNSNISHGDVEGGVCMSSQTKLIWKDDGTNSQKWIRRIISTQIKPDSMGKMIDIIIEVDIGQSATPWESDIAVDDILIASCNQIKTYEDWLEKHASTMVPQPVG